MIGSRGFYGMLATLTLGFFLAGCEQKAGAPGEARIPEVVVVDISVADIPLETELPGRIAPLRVAQVRPQVGGIVKKRLFEEGSNVTAGQVLYQIEDAQYQASVDSARAELARNEAIRTKAQLREKRLTRLINTKAVSEEDYDLSKAELKQAEAGVAAARAALKSANIDLGYTQIVAPISGRIGKSLITEGALMEAEQEEELAVIQQLDRVYVDITQSSTEMLRLKRELSSGRLVPPAGAMILHLRLDDGSQYEHAGTLQFSEVSVDESTSSVTLRGILPNPDQLLLPGMFVRANIEQGTRKNSVLAPQRGVTFDYSGTPAAMVVGEGNKVERREIKVAQAVGDQWLVLDGLSAGDQIIVEGLQKIKAGVEVNVVQAVANDTAEKH
ncbi:MAG: efflux transporter periplasmic adaptor subunit [Gammaproteobacteria bacterium]|nr:MAG: efflux transporter periplasmic adaptor subunit [Gammaproteobacteria bacterium]